jgi:nucleoid-associated protein YgaU
VHVTDDFDVIPSGATKSTAVGAGTGNGPASSLPATARKGSEVADAQSYNVRRGDCLSKIAERAYGRQAWTVLFRANRSQIRNPNLIYPGQILQLPPI